MNLLQEGGPFFMYTLLLLLIVSLALIIVGFVKDEKREKTIELLSSIGLFALIFGFLGQTIGLIGAFDAIEDIGNISPGILAGGLKVSFLSTGFGALVFLVARFGIIAFTFMKKE